MAHRYPSTPSTQRFDLMLLLLAGVAGSIDVMSYFRLQHVFTANMTGNTILLGLSIGQGKLASSLHSMAALLGFIIGALLGSLIVENKKRNWRFYIRLSFGIESGIIAILTILWFRHREPLTDAALFISIGLSAIAMGMQSATVRNLKIPGVVTTFITGTITSIAMSLVQGARQGFKKQEKTSGMVPISNLEQRFELQLMVFFAYGLTAVFTGWVEFHGPQFLPVLPLLLILIVVGIVGS